MKHKVHENSQPNSAILSPASSPPSFHGVAGSIDEATGAVGFVPAGEVPEDDEELPVLPSGCR